jgi:hypothetical protein
MCSLLVLIIANARTLRQQKADATFWTIQKDLKGGSGLSRE